MLLSHKTFTWKDFHLHLNVSTQKYTKTILQLPIPVVFDMEKIPNALLWARVRWAHPSQNVLT